MSYFVYDLFKSSNYEFLKEKEITEYLEDYNREKEKLLQQLNEEQQKSLKSITGNLDMHNALFLLTYVKRLFFGIKLVN